jgi:hypothetical protein
MFAREAAPSQKPQLMYFQSLFIIEQLIVIYLCYM